MRKFLQSALRGWHEETVGKKKRIEGLQKVFLGHSRKAMLKDVFRQWFACVKNWRKAKKVSSNELKCERAAKLESDEHLPFRAHDSADSKIHVASD